LGFRGGKGVATGVGAFLVLTPLPGVAIGMLFMIVFWRTRYVSLGSITAAAALPLFILLQNVFVKPVAGFQSVIFAAVSAAILIIFMHRENIARLRAGTENKFR
jgi:glycerol-3-phosphate acyltransferase PlsY